MPALPAPNIEFLRRIVHVLAATTPPGGDVVLVGWDAWTGEVEFLGPAVIAPVVGVGGHFLVERVDGLSVGLVGKRESNVSLLWRFSFKTVCV